MSYLGQSFPSPPKVRVGDNANSVAELGLDAGGTIDHQADEALFYDSDLILGEFVVAVLVLGDVCSASGPTVDKGERGLAQDQTHHITGPNEVLEGQSGRKSGVVG